MRITDINDDAKLAALNRPASARKVLQPVAPTEAANRVQPINPEQRRAQRAHPERRQNQRRDHLQENLLDTRDPHERRKLVRRQEDREQQEKVTKPATQGIDVIA